jgi:hypothetical protein
VWHAKVTQSGIRRTKLASCQDETTMYPGQSVLRIQHRSGAIGTFTFANVRRGRYNVRFAFSCPDELRYIDSVGLYTKVVSGPGLTDLVWN